MPADRFYREKAVTESVGVRADAEVTAPVTSRGNFRYATVDCPSDHERGMAYDPETDGAICPLCGTRKGARCGICGGRHDAYSALCPPERGKRCGHTHDCACGRNLPLAHRDPNYQRQGFCAQPCAYCDALDASEAEGVR